MSTTWPPATEGGVATEVDPVAGPALATAVADLNASIATRQAAATAATDAELAALDAELDAAIDAVSAEVATRQAAATAATDAELAAAVASLTTLVGAKADAATAATDAELDAAIAGIKVPEYLTPKVNSAWYFGLGGAPNSTCNIGSGAWESSPVYIVEDLWIDALGFSVTGVASAGMVTRLGIYELTAWPTSYSAPNTLTGTLIKDAGTVDDSTTGDKLATFAPLKLDKGKWYMLINLHQGLAAGTTSGSYRCQRHDQAGYIPPPMGHQGAGMNAAPNLCIRHTNAAITGLHGAGTPLPASHPTDVTAWVGFNRLSSGVTMRKVAAP